MIYLLDTNVFIQSQRRHYGMDLAPGFWDFLDQGLADKSLLSIESVYGELVPKKKEDYDPLAEWVEKRKRSFVSLDSKTQTCMKKIAKWVMSPERIYKPAAQAEFLKGIADYPLIAFAMAHGVVLVTEEVSEPNCKKKVKIPDVCIAFGVEYTDTFSMMRDKGAKLILA